MNPEYYNWPLGTTESEKKDISNKALIFQPHLLNKFADLGSISTKCEQVSQSGSFKTETKIDIPTVAASGGNQQNTTDSEPESEASSTAVTTIQEKKCQIPPLSNYKLIGNDLICGDSGFLRSSSKET